MTSLRRWFLFLVPTRLSTWGLGLFLVLELAGCSRDPSITVTWKGNKEGPAPGMKVFLGAAPVGEIRSVSRPAGATVAVIQLSARAAAEIPGECSFYYKAAPEGGGGIQIVVLNAQAKPLSHGARYEAAESEGEARVRQIAANWKVTAVVCGIALLFLVLLLFIAKSVLKLGAVVVSLAAGLASALFFGERLIPLIPALGLDQVNPRLAAFMVALVAGTLAASLLMGIVLKPLRKG